MKLLIITSLKEDLSAISKFLKVAKIEVFSVSKTTGMKLSDGSDLLEDWFGSHGGDFDSIFLFSFTDDDKAGKTLGLVESYNRNHDTGFPIRAFILPVDRSNQ